MMQLTTEQRAILEGLSIACHCEISATEMRHRDVLKEAGLVEVWSVAGGFCAWRITEKGRAEMEKGRG